MKSAQQSVDEPSGTDGGAQTKGSGWRGMTRDIDHWGYIIPSFCAGVVATGLVLEVARLIDLVPLLINYSTIIIVLVTIIALVGKRIG